VSGVKCQVSGGRARIPHSGGWIASRYELGDLLGEGGTSVVHRAFDHDLRRWVALKLYALERALPFSPQEVRLQAQVQHPNLMPLYDAGVDAEQYVQYLAMPLYPGDDLETILRREGPLPPRRALNCVDQVLSALDFLLYRRGAVHGDVKPENIWVTRSGATVLMDLNLARALSEEPLGGTPGYTAPEVFDGQLDSRADVFSTGCVLYYALCGQPPFRSNDEACFSTPPPPSAFGSDLRPELDELCLIALSKEPEWRFQSPREMQGTVRHPYLLTGAGRRGRLRRGRRGVLATIGRLAKRCFRAIPW